MRTAKRQIALRQSQPKFRARVLEAYRGRCAVTQCDLEEPLEAAHIVPYLGEQTNIVTNGLLLRADVHSLFGRGQIAIDPEALTILLAERLHGTRYADLAGKVIVVPQEPTSQPARAYLQSHRSFANL